MKGSILRVKPRKIVIGGQEFEFRFDMNTMCELEDIYAPIARKAAEALKEGEARPTAMETAFSELAAGSFRAIRNLLFCGIRHDLPEDATPEDVGSMIGALDVSAIQAMVMTDAMGNLPEPSEATAGE